MSFSLTIETEGEEVSSSPRELLPPHGRQPGGVEPLGAAPGPLQPQPGATAVSTPRPGTRCGRLAHLLDDHGVPERGRLLQTLHKLSHVRRQVCEGGHLPAKRTG